MCGIEVAMAERPAPDPDLLEATTQSLFEAKRFAVQLAIERQHLSDAVDTMRDDAMAAARDEVAPLVDAARAERDAAQAERDAAHAERNAAFIERDAALADRDRARDAARDAAAMLDRVTSSTAWRLTGPVRRLLQTVLGRP